MSVSVCLSVCLSMFGCLRAYQSSPLVRVLYYRPCPSYYQLVVKCCSCYVVSFSAIQFPLIGPSFSISRHALVRESKTNASKETKHYYCNQLLLSGQQQNTLHNFAIVPIASQYRKFGRSPILSQRIVVVGTCLCNSVAARRKDDAE